jgi:hypothetical protein
LQPRNKSSPCAWMYHFPFTLIERSTNASILLPKKMRFAVMLSCWWYSLTSERCIRHHPQTLWQWAKGRFITTQYANDLFHGTHKIRASDVAVCR